MKQAKLLQAGLTAAALCLAGMTASAATIQLTYQNNLSGGPTGSITGVGSTIYAGEFDFSTAGDTMYWNDGLSAFCIQIDTTLKSSASYTVQSGLGGFSSTQQDRIDRLFSNYHALSQDGPGNSAAFQLALWEIINESDDALSLSGGTFSSTGFSGARATANAWLSDLGDSSGAYEYYVFTAGDSQNLLTARPVPEPAMIALLGAGLLAVAAVRVRRRAVPAGA